MKFDIEKLISGINPAWTNLEKALYIYVELEKTTKDMNSKEVAETYKQAMDMLDIPCKVINGLEKNAWNEIMIDGQFYPLDLSWDIDYFNSKDSNGKIGVCNFLVNKNFYEYPGHSSEMEKPKYEEKKPITTEQIEKALNIITGNYEDVEVLDEPAPELKSKELKGILESYKEEEQKLQKTEQSPEVKIALSDANTEDLKSDIKTIGRYYPQMLRNVVIENKTSAHIDMQDVVDEIYKAKTSLARTKESQIPMSITISSDNVEDFDLDFSAAPAISVNESMPLNEVAARQAIVLKNTSGNTIKLPEISDKISKNITSVAFDGFDLQELDLTKTNVESIKISSELTKNLGAVQGINGVEEVTISRVPDDEFDDYIKNIYPTSRNLHDLQIDHQHLHNRKIFDELAVNPDLARLIISSSELNKLDGLDKFNGRLGQLGLFANDLEVSDLPTLNAFRENNPYLEIYTNANKKIRDEINKYISQISDESCEYIYNRIVKSGDHDISHKKIEAIDRLMWNMGDIPYYVKDAKILRDKLNITRNPMMLENESEINSINFDEDYLKDGTLLLSKSQLDALLNSGKVIPQNIMVKIDNVSELSSDEIKDYNQKFSDKGMHLTGVQFFDEKIDNTHTQIDRYSLSEYVYIRDTLDLVVDGISSVEPDINKFATVYTRLADSIAYNHAAVKHKDRASDLYYAEKRNSSRNLLDGLIDGECVCAGYADILRNALALVDIDCRLVSGLADKSRPNSGHAWNQVAIVDSNGHKKWYNTDLTWDRQKDDIMGQRKNFDHMLRGKNYRSFRNRKIETKDVENVELTDFDRDELRKALVQAKQRSFDFSKNREAIDIPADPTISIDVDEDKIKDEFKRRTDDMFAKYYGNKDYQAEYKVRAERYRANEVEATDGGYSYKTIADYAEKEEDERFLILGEYKERLERMSRYQAGDTTVYTGTQAQIDAAYKEDRQYVETRNNTFNQHANTQKDLATLGKYGEKMPYIPKQKGVVRNIGRAAANTGIFVRNVFTPVYRGIGKFVAKPIHRLVTGGKDASPYRNNPFHRMVARRDYFLEAAQERDMLETQDKMLNSSDPSTVKPVNHPIRNSLESRFKAIFSVKKGNEAVLRAGAADIKANIRNQESQKAFIDALESQAQNYRDQINKLTQELTMHPHAKNKKDVVKAINDKISKMNTIEAKLSNMTMVADIQTDAISSEQHAIASKEVNTLRTTVIKGVAKGFALKCFGPKIKDWILEKNTKVETQNIENVIENPNIPGKQIKEKDVWVPTTYKNKVTPVYEDALDTSVSMKDMMSLNKGKEVTGFYSVYGGENLPDVYKITGDEKITAVFKAINDKGTGLSDTVGLKAPTLTDGTFANSMMDSAGFLKQDTTITQLLEGVNTGAINPEALDGIYVAVGDKYWTKLSDLTGDLVKHVKVDEITQKVVDVAGHYEKVQEVVENATQSQDAINKVVNGVTTIKKTVVNPTAIKGVEIGSKVAKGAVAMDSIIDVVENVRKTTTDVESNKKKPRRYEYEDDDIKNLPTSNKEYKDREDR